ncbi:hypothetical protein ACIQXI_21675 [Lysinibacillus sp. NPDC097195]|uniref:hypothetical protein n=1 Tax=Lysinibacillus sp. NPDC097195 TaxID=3364141 RepID=UPI00380AD247
MFQKCDYGINRYSEKAFKKDGTPIKLSDPFLAAREVSREGGIDNFLDKHYEERKHDEWQQENPYNNNLTLEQTRELEEIASFENSNQKSIFDI